MSARIQRCKEVVRLQGGFTLIELVLVITILGILAAVMLPRFADLGADARTITVQAVGSNLASAVALARSGWVAGGSSATAVVMDGTSVGVTSGGWPENDNSTTPDDSVTAAECVEIWNSVLTSPPSVSSAAGAEYRATAASPSCTYTLQANTGYGISYNISTGQVTVDTTPGGGC